MYQMFLKARYDIKIKKVLQFKQDDVFKRYVEDLYEMKKQYSLENKKAITFIVKIMLNALYGNMLVNKERFRNLKIITNEKQAEKYIKMNNIHSFIEINKNLNIIELKKVKVVYDSPILIGSQILMNSKCDLYDYMYNILPKLFSNGKESITYSFRDTDSIAFHLNDVSYKKYTEICNNHHEYFNKDMGGIKNEVNENINEIISLRSKTLSIQELSNIDKESSWEMKKSKGINNNYRKLYHTHDLYKKVLFNNNNKKCQYYKIVRKDGKLLTKLEIKDDINNFNDKMFMTDNLTSKPHEING